MAVVTPPQITPPPPKPQRGDKATFRERVDDFITWMIAVVAQFAALAQNVFSNAQDAAGSAGAANQSAIDAGVWRNQASGFRNEAEGFKNQAFGYRNEAEGFKNAAAQSAAALRGTSVNALTIGVGSKSLTTETGRQFDAGQTLKLVVVGNGEAWMSGRVTSYNSATGALVVNVLAVATAYAGQGSNTWNLYVAGEVGPAGPQGSLSGGTLTGAINLRRANGVPIVNGVADVWSGSGNFMVLNGPGTVTDFPDAPQAGAQRTVYVSGATTIQSGARILVYGGTQALSTGDLLDIEALEVNVFLATVRKRDGTPVAHDRGALHNLRVYGGSGVFVAPRTGWYKITCIGGSGSPGAVSTTAAVGTGGATGAGAGGFVSGMRYLTAGVAYVVTVGAGGAGFTLAASAVPVGQNGNDGSASSFSGAGITTMTANGGTKGLHTGETGNALPAAPGGTATGAAGDVTATGGSGGYMQPLEAGCLAATGGGSVGIRGAGQAGGDAQATGGNALAAAGGAGVGGKGGNAIASANQTCCAAGGGCSSAAANLTNTTATVSQAGANHRGVNGGDAHAAQPNDLESATGGGQASNSESDTAPNGGGSVGRNGGTGANQGVGNRAGMFSGSGGYAARYNVTHTGNSPGLYGGAPGGVAVCSTSGNTRIVNAPAGSSGEVVIEW